MTELTFAILKYCFVCAILLFAWLAVRSLYRDVAEFLPARDRTHVKKTKTRQRVAVPQQSSTESATHSAAPRHTASTRLDNPPHPEMPSLASIVTNTVNTSSSRSSKPTLLVLIDGPRAGATFPLSTQPITLGRSTTNTVVLNDEYVSSHHARLYLDPRTKVWMLEDTGSTNGTYVNESRILDVIALEARIPVRIGATTFELR
ncbi:MAG: FHA domain-containing protein [Aeriscardovia sp.]|nr:FHA domain-containing protein [Aeriscardovia sp.]